MVVAKKIKQKFKGILKLILVIFCISWKLAICLFWTKKNCCWHCKKNWVSLLLHHYLRMYCLKFLDFVLYEYILFSIYRLLMLFWRRPWYISLHDFFFNIIENLNIFVVGIFYYHLIMGVKVNKIQEPSLRNSVNELRTSFPKFNMKLQGRGTR